MLSINKKEKIPAEKNINFNSKFFFTTIEFNTNNYYPSIKKKEENQAMR